VGSYFSSLFFAISPYISSFLLYLVKRVLEFSTPSLAPRIFRSVSYGLGLRPSLFYPFPPRLFSFSPLRLLPDSLRLAPCAVCFVVAFLLSLFGQAQSAQVTLQWDPNSDPSVAGYKVHYGTSSRSYGVHVDVGNTASCTISSLLDGVTYYFAATTVDSSGAESDYSSEVVYSGPSGCTYSLSPSTQSFSSSAGVGSVGLTVGSGCSWTAVSNASWVILTSNSNGTGSATVNYSVSANLSSASRSGTLTIAGKTFTVNQSGTACSYSLSSSSQSFTSTGGTGTINVNATGGCFWSASSDVSWITITSGSSGSGNGTTGYSVSANTGRRSRTGTLTVGGQTFTVSQERYTKKYFSVEKKTSAP